MGEKIDIVIEVDDSDLKEAESEVQEFQQEATRIIEEVDQRRSEVFYQVLSMARSTYLIGLGLVKASGASVNYFFRSMISAAFGTISVLMPLLQASLAKGEATYDPWAIAQSLIGLGELGIAIAATVAAQQQQGEIARGLRGSAMALGGLQQLLTTFQSIR